MISDVRKNMIYNVLLSSASLLFPLISIPYITRTLSPESFGQVVYVDAFTQYFLLFSTLGVPYYGVREVAKVKHNKLLLSSLVTELVLIQIVTTCFSVLLFFTLANVLPLLHKSINLVKVGCFILIIQLLIWDWFYQGIESFSYITKRTIFSRICSLIFLLVTVKHANDSLYYYLTNIVWLTLNAIFNARFFFKNYYTPVFSNLNIKKHIRPLLILFSINLSISFYSVLDTILLGSLSNEKYVSYYTVAIKIPKLYWSVIGAIGVVLIPRFSVLLQNGITEEVKAIMKKSINIVLMLTLPFIVFSLFFSKEIIFLISGSKYEHSATALQIFSVLPLILGFFNIYGSQFLFPLKKEKFILIATLMGLVVSVTINLILIPILKDVGSAIASLCAETTVCSVIYYFARKEVIIRIDKNLLLLMVATSILAIPVFLLIKYWLSSYWLLVAGGISYGIIFFVLQLYFKNAFIEDIVSQVFRKQKGVA